MRDAKVNRDVAFKILPESFALDPDRVARFKREAQVLASLNHPSIAAFYGCLEQLDVSRERKAARQRTTHTGSDALRDRRRNRWFRCDR